MSEEKKSCKEQERKLRPWTASPLKADGTVDKEHYQISLHTEDGERQLAKASEWGAIGEIMDAMRKVGEDGKRKLHMTVVIRAGEKINEADAPAGQGERTDSEADAADLIRAIRAMADLSYTYFD